MRARTVSERQLDARQRSRRAAPRTASFDQIKAYADEVVRRFKPDKIILFGSYAYGRPHNESDVDLLVIMPTRNAIDQAIRIDLAFERMFSLDVHVRTPYQIKQGLKEGDCDWFLREIIEKGKVLYEAEDGAVGPVRRRGLASGKRCRRQNSSAAKRDVLPLPAGSGEVPESPPPRTRHRRAKDA
jgi:predicted nucleotidyltransferase